MIISISSLTRETAIQWIVSALLMLYLAGAPIRSEITSSGAGLIALISLIFGISQLRHSDRQTRIVFFGFFLYVATALLSLVNNSNWHDAGWRFESYHPFLLAIPIWGLLYRLDNKLFPALVSALIIAGLLLLGLSIYSYVYLDVQRIGLWSGFNPNIFSYIAGLVATVLLAALLYLKNSLLVRALILIAFAGAVFAVLLSGSRGVLVGFIVASISIAAMNGNAFSRKKHLVAIWLIVVLLIAAVVFATVKSSVWLGHWQQLYSEVLSLSSTAEFKYSSTNARIYMWIGGWQIWMDNFWFGTGLGDGQDDFDQLKMIGSLVVAENVELVKDFSHHIFHNIFVDSFATTGVIGGITMIITMLFLPFRYFKKVLSEGANNHRLQFVALAGIGICWMNFIFGLTNSWLYLNNLPYTLTLVLALMVVVRKQLNTIE